MAEALSQLRRLADRGLAAFPPDALRRLSSDCAHEANSTSDGRVSVLADCWNLLDTYWDAGAITTSNVAELDAMLASPLPWVLDEPDLDAAEALARHLREELKLFVAEHPPL